MWPGSGRFGRASGAALSTPANASGGTATLAAATGLKGLGAMGIFATGFVATVSLIVQNVGTLPQAAIVTNAPSTVSSASALKLPGQAQVLGADPVGAGQVMVRMPAFTTPGAADRLGQTYGMELVGLYPAFGRYLFNLPQIRVEPADTSSRALVFFPPRASAGEINAYLAANQLKVERWYRTNVLAGETPERTALVTLPRITPVMVDGVRGIWKSIIPMNIDSTRLSAWATTAGIHVISYDPSTGALLIKGPAIAPRYVVTKPPVRRAAAPVVTQHVVTPPAPQPVTQQLFVTFVLSTTSDVALAAIQQAGAQMVSFDATTGIAVVNVTSGNTTAVTTLLSAATIVKCVNTSAAAACTAPAPAVTPAPVVTPAPLPVSAPVALRILPDTTSFSGTVLLSADVQSGDGTGVVAWTLSGALANLTLNGATVAPIAGNPLAWTSTVNFDSTSVADGAYTLSIRIQDGLGNVTTANRSVTVSNAKPAQPTGFAAAPVPAGVALTWQQPAVADAALYRVSRDGVQLAELPAGTSSYVDATAAAGAHTYQLVLVNRFGNASDPVSTGLTIVTAPVATTITLQVLLPGGEQLAADGLAGGHVILSASSPQTSTPLSFQYTLDGTSWASVSAAVACSTSCTADWNLGGFAPGHYRVRAVADQLVSDEAGFIIAANPALPAPTALVATATTWGVDLHWTAPAGLIPPAYLVSRQTSTGWSPLAQSSALDYTDASAVAGQSYSYRVQAIGSDGTAGTPSDSASITLRGAATTANPSATGPAAPSGLRVVDGPGGATLLWQPVPGVTRYVVERALDSAGTFQPMPAVATLMFRDTAQRVGGQVYYRVRSVGSNGVGDPSAVVAGIVLPGPAASTPAPFVVASSSGQWAASTGDVALGADQAAPVRAGRSVVVRAGGSTAGVDQADVQKLAGTSWLTLLTLTTTVTPGGWTAASSIDLTGVGAGDLQLRAVAKSAGGATLAVTAPATVQVVHSAPMPTSLRASSSGTAVSLSWTPPASSAPLTYNVYRAAGSGGYTLAASGLSTPAFDDRFLAGKVAVSYVVTATDDLGNQSTWSAPASLVTPAAWSQAPPTLQLLLPSSATLGDTVLLQATAGSTRGIDSFTFAYSPQGSSVWINLPDRFPLAIGGPTLAGLTGLAAWAALFKTPGLAAGTYTVRATATDTLGHSTDAVRTLTVAASQSRGPPAPNFTINATASVGAVHLDWNAAGASYQVERSTDGAAGPFKAIGTTTSNTFDDRLLIPGFAYAYRVIALGAGSTTSSTVSVTPLATPSSGTTSSDQLVNVLLPAASASALNVSIAPASLTSSMQAGMHAVGSAYDINATSLGSGAQVHLLDQAATLTFSLPAGLSAAQAAGLAVYHWDSALGAWRLEPSTLDLAAGRITATVNHFSTFAVATPPQISGTVFEDLTGDGLTSEDAPLPGITVNLYLDGGVNPVASAVSAADGTYSFSNLGPGTYTLAEVLPANTILTAHPAGTIVLPSLVPSIGNDFDNFRRFAISGTVFQDLTGDGLSLDDPPFPGVTVELFLNGATTPVATTISAGDGTFSFTDLGPGDYTLGEVVPIGYALSAHPYGPITAISGLTSTGNDFDNVVLALTADLAVTMTGPQSAVEGSNITYQITLTNNGPVDATGLRLLQTGFVNTSYVSFTLISGPPLDGTLAASATQIFELIMTINLTTPHGAAITSGVTVSARTGDPDLTNNSASVSTTVIDAPLSATGVDVATTEGATTFINPPPTFNGVVATFTDANFKAVAGDFTATINWGDLTTPSDGTINPNNQGGFSVAGSHTYMEEGSYRISVTITDVAGPTATASSTATVADAPLVSSSSAGSLALHQGVSFTGDLAIFADANSSATSSDWTATIDWGDGSPIVAGTISQPGPQTFDVSGTHTYLLAGSFTYTVNFADAGGTSGHVTGIADVAPSADLSIVITGPPTVLINGDGHTAPSTVSYSITVTNSGPSAADGVNVNYTLPAGTTLASFVQNTGSMTGTLPAGGTMTFTLTVTVPDATADGVLLSAGASVTATTFDPDGSHNSSTATTLVTHRADMAVTNVSIRNTGSGPIVAGIDSFVSHIVIINGGPSAARDVVLIDTLPAGLTRVQVYPTAGISCQPPQAGQVVCTVDSLAAGQSQVVDVLGREDAPGDYTNSATVSATTLDTNLGNNTAVAITHVVPQRADVAVTVESLPSTVFEGVTFTTRVTVTNHGPNTALNVNLVDTLQAGLSGVQALVNGIGLICGSLQPVVQLACDVASLNAGQSVTVDLVAYEALPGVYTNTATVTSDTLDPNLANNTASAATTVNDGDLSATGVDVATTEGATFTGIVATFTDASPNGAVSDFTATITWGDGSTPSAGTIVLAGTGQFSVTGSHTYMEEGTYTISVAITDIAGPTASATSTARVADAPILDANVADPPTLIQGVSFTADIAVFAEANFNATLDDWSASVAWGDGTTPAAGTMFQVGPQTFGVRGTHTYMTAGTFTFTVLFVDVGGTRGVLFGVATVAPSADLVLAMTGPETVLTGHAIVYTATITNIGLSAAGNVNLYDLLPAFTSLITVTGISGPSLGGTLPAGGSMVIELRVHVDGNTPDGTVLVNTATVTSTTHDSNPANNSSTVTTTALDGALSATGVAIAATEGATFTGVVANFTDANDGGNVADFTATIDWGDGTTPDAGAITTDFVTFSVTGSHTYLDEGSYTVSVSIVDVAGPAATAGGTAIVADAPLTRAGVVNIDATRTVAFSGAVASFGDANRNATISDYTVTIDWGDGSATSFGTVVAIGSIGFVVLGTHTYSTAGIFPLTVDIVDDGGSTAHAVGTATVAAAADLSIVMTGPASVLAGTEATYSITVSNAGPDAAENVTVSPIVPAHTTLVSFAQNPGPLFSGTLAAGDTLTFTLVLAVAASTPEGSVLSVAANVSSTTADPTAGNNSSTVDTAVTTQADLLVTKTGPLTVVAGNNIEYTITVINNGPSDAQNVTLVDATPLNTTWVSTMQTYGPALGGTLPAGGRMAFTLVVFVAGDIADGTVITNTAEVRSTTLDASSSNNVATVSTQVLDGALTATGVGVATTEGATSFPIADARPTFSGEVATFTDANTSATIGDFTATIDWGDAAVLDAGTILLLGPGSFSVTGSHTYMEEGSYAISVEISDVAGPTASATSTATVSDAPLLSSDGTTITATQGVGFTALLAGFAEANYNATIDDWSGTVDWGDGSPMTAGTISQVGPQTFGVNGTHTYLAAGTFTYTVDFVDVGGTRGHVSGTVIVAPSVDLSIVKTGPETARAGSEITYTITVTNNGLSTAQNVLMTEGAVPAHLTFVAGSFSQTSGPANGGPLAAGATMNFTLRFTVDSDAPGGTVITNTATVTTTTFDPDTTNNSSSVDTTVIGGADLEVRISGPDRPTEGDPTDYVVDLTNHGLDTATEVNFGGDGQVPNGAINVLAIARDQQSGLTCLLARCTVASLASGHSVVMILRLVFALTTPHVAGSVTYSVTGQSQTFDPNTANNTASLVIQVRPNIVVSVPDLHAVEGLFSGVVATFAAGNSTADPSAFSATITWDDGSTSAGTITASGDGYAVSGTHTFAEEGRFPISVVVDHVSAMGVALVADAALTATGVDIHPIEGAEFSGAVATFTDADPAGTLTDYTATVDWGDHTSSPGAVSANLTGGFTVSGHHTYSEEGSFPITVSVADAGGSSATASVTASVSDAALTATGTQIIATEGAIFNGVVATFTDADPNGMAGDYLATISWGDGTSSGTVAVNGAGFSVSGMHTYAEEGAYTVSVVIADAGSSVTATSPVSVADASLHAQGVSLPATRFRAFAGTVATFTDDDPGGVVSDYIATINWGDGMTSIGRVSALGGSFVVSSTHMFAEGRFTITTTIADTGGATAAATSTITVDLTAPVTVATVNGTLGQNGWWTAVELNTLILTATDNLTGVAATYFTINGGPAHLYTGPISLDDGKYVIQFWSVDGVGNVEAVHTIRIKVKEGHVEKDRDSEDGNQHGGSQRGDD